MPAAPLVRVFHALAAAALFAAALPVRAAEPPVAAAPVTLRFVSKEGEKSRYQNTGTITGPGLGGGTVEQKSTNEEKTTVTKEGGALVTTRVLSHAVTYNGMEVPGVDASAFPVVETTFDRSGTVTAYKALGAFPAPADPKIQEALTFTGSLGLPEKPVSPGETWTLTLPNRLIAGKTFTSTLTYVGRETLDGRPADRLHQVWAMDLPDNKGTLKGDLTLYLEAETGRKLKATGTVSGLPTDQFGPLTIAVAQTLVPAAAEEPKKDEAKKESGA